jgi:membrane-associated protein
VGNLVSQLLTLPAWLVLLVSGALVFAEDALFVGFVLPAETAAVLAGVAANRGHVSLTAVLIAVALAAIIGDTVGYEVGRQLGPRILRWHRLDTRSQQIEQARGLLARRGGLAVFLGRFVAFLRAMMPFLAGSARMPYRTFLAFNAAGGLLWATAVVLLGYFAGASYATIEKYVGQGAALAVLAVVIIGLLIWRLRRHRRKDSSAGSASLG